MTQSMPAPTIQRAERRPGHWMPGRGDLHRHVQRLKHSRPIAILALLLASCGTTKPTEQSRVDGPSVAPVAVDRHDSVASDPAPIQLGAIAVDRTAGSVRVPGVVALREGWLEQAVCQQGTRDHESLVTVSMPPSSIHAALLLAGLQPGRPGHWRVRDDGSLELVPPTGDAVLIDVEWHDASGALQLAPLVDWIKTGGSATPGSFVFAGSIMRDRAAVPYAADQSGSVVGLVTFGDEPVASVAVVPDRADIAEPSLMAWTERMPPEGTTVTIVIRRAAPAR